MSIQLRSDTNVFLIGYPIHQILGSKLPTVRQVLSVFFCNMRNTKLKARESASLAVRECMIFWEKVRIPLRALQHCITKLINIYNIWRNLQKNSHKIGEKYRQNEKKFTQNLDKLFDVAHSEALNKMKNQEDRTFLINQRQIGRPGSIGGIDKQQIIKEKCSLKRKMRDETNYDPSNSILSQNSICINNEDDDDDTLKSDEDNDEYIQIDIEESPANKKKRGKLNFITPKLVGALDRCKLSVRDSIYVIQATAEALGHNVDDLILNKSSIHRCRTSLRAERARYIKQHFQKSPPKYVVVHWDGKLLPPLNVRSSPVERLPIVVCSQNIEQLIGVPKLVRSTGHDQALAVCEAIDQWGLSNTIEALCCDTTASNTGRINGACILIEQKLNKDLLYLPCRHHIYELVLRCVFEAKLPQITNSPDIPLFKKFQKYWNKIDVQNMKSGMDDVICRSAVEGIRDDTLKWCKRILDNEKFRHDYRELLELVIQFLNGDKNKSLRIRPPGAMHQARWMSRAIYCLKIYMFRNQFNISKSYENGLRDICLFIIKMYVNAWFTCPKIINAPAHDLSFIQNLIHYEKQDPDISKAALKKLSNHLWYLSEESAALAFFDDTLPNEIKRSMVAALQNVGSVQPSKRLMIQPKDMVDTVKAKTIDSFITSNSLKLFSRFGIGTDFLNCDPTTWNNDANYLIGIEIIKSIKVVNDTAERAVKLMEDFHGLITIDEEQKEFLLLSVQEHRRKFPDCKKETLNNKL